MKKAFSVMTLAILTGCGGGGGGGGSATLTPFVNWSSVTPNTSISVSGDSQEGTYTYNTNTEKVTSFTPTPRASGASYQATYNAQGNATAATLTSARGTVVSFSQAAGDTFGTLVINSDIDAVVSQDGSKYAIAANPRRFGFEYQSFGIWATGGGTGSGTVGEMSVGAATAPSAVPTQATATFTGITGGRYLAATGDTVFTSSSMSATVDFAARTIAFSTTNTSATPDLLNTSSATGLNMTGSLSYAANSAQFTGNVSTVSGLTGTADGRFFGPTAQEMGGTFRLSGTGLEGYAGAFGAKR